MKKRSLTLICIAIRTLAVVMLAMCSCGKGSDGAMDIDKEAPNQSYKSDGSFNNGMLDLPEGDGTQKLIRTCSVEAETRDFDTATASLNERISQFGGYVESQNSTGSSYNSSRGSRRLTVTVRIPAEKFGDFVAGLGDIMNVTGTTSEVQNITEAYYDTEARLETLKAERESLQKMMASIDNAKEYDFWLTMQTRLSTIEQDIASLEAKLRTYDNRVSYSTVRISLNEVIEYTPAASPTFAERVSRSFKSSWKSFASFWQDFAVWIVSLLPVIITLSVIAGAVVIIVVSATKKKNKK